MVCKVPIKSFMLLKTAHALITYGLQENKKYKDKNLWRDPMVLVELLNYCLNTSIHSGLVFLILWEKYLYYIISAWCKVLAASSSSVIEICIV